MFLQNHATGRILVLLVEIEIWHTSSKKKYASSLFWWPTCRVTVFDLWMNKMMCKEKEKLLLTLNGRMVLVFSSSRRPHLPRLPPLRMTPDLSNLPPALPEGALKDGARWRQNLALKSTNFVLSLV
jgi:hypothetical protein